MTRIIIVTGERDWSDKQTIYNVLDEQLADFLDPNWRDIGGFLVADCNASARSKFVLRHGVCEGADWIANDWGKERGVTIERFLAQWRDHTGYHPEAGPVRNRQMAAALPRADKVVAFWSGKLRIKFGKREYSGTFDMIQAALAAGIPVLVTPPARVKDASAEEST